MPSARAVGACRRIVPSRPQSAVCQRDERLLQACGRERAQSSSSRTVRRLTAARAPAAAWRAVCVLGKAAALASPAHAGSTRSHVACRASRRMPGAARARCVPRATPYGAGWIAHGRFPLWLPGDTHGSLVHEGSPVTRGAKYVVRTEVLYKAAAAEGAALHSATLHCLPPDLPLPAPAYLARRLAARPP
jgi:hypothetical protein